jgi:hypothetical protein
VGEKAENQRKTREKFKVSKNKCFGWISAPKKRTVHTLSGWQMTALRTSAAAESALPLEGAAAGTLVTNGVFTAAEALLEGVPLARRRPEAGEYRSAVAD